MEINSVKLGEEHYPKLLSYIADPPTILYYTGDIELANQTAVSVVGARKASSYGRWASFQLGSKLAEYGIVSVSGMAYGIDSQCHKGSIKMEGKTIAVLGSGVDVCYPREHLSLMQKIEETGLVLSEQEPGTQPRGWMFPLRNRIISGLSVSTVIVEAGLESGSLITAECAAQQGRNVYAVPGNINNVNSIGTNKLIRDGAIPLSSLDDIIYDLGLNKIISQQKINSLSSTENELLEVISLNGEVTKDFICQVTKKLPSEVSSIITILEIKGFVYSEMGKIFVAK